jgi:hypothetical protein
MERLSGLDLGTSCVLVGWEPVCLHHLRERIDTAMIHLPWRPEIMVLGLVGAGAHKLKKRRRKMPTPSPLKSSIIQTGMFVLALLGIAIAAERRMTAVETNYASEHEIRITHEKWMAEVITNMQGEIKELQKAQVRVVTKLDEMDKRHATEDIRRANKK